MKTSITMTVILLLISTVSIASPRIKEIRSFASFAGQASYCQLYYASVNDSYNESLMYSYEVAMSKRLSLLFKSQYDVNAASIRRKNAFADYQKKSKKQSKASCRKLIKRFKNLL